MEVCVICKQPIANEVPVSLGEKGSMTINKASESSFDVIHAIMDNIYTTNVGENTATHSK